MNLAQLRAFHAVARFGTFSAAAQALAVSQPAITQHVRALEDAIGSRLFHRRGSGVELTADGSDLLVHVSQMIKGLEDISARLDSGRHLRTGHLALGFCSPHVTMPLIRRFRAAYPGVRLDMRLHNSRHLLDLARQMRIDLAILTLACPESDLVCHRLVDQRVLLVVPSDHPWAGRPEIDIAELAGQPFVLREQGSMTQQIFDSGLAARGIEIQAELMVASREAAKEAVAAGIGLGVVLDRELGEDGRLVGVTIAGAELAAAEYIVAHPDVSHLGAVREFIALSADAALGR